MLKIHLDLYIHQSKFQVDVNIKAAIHNKYTNDNNILYKHETINNRKQFQV